MFTETVKRGKVLRSDEFIFTSKEIINEYENCRQLCESKSNGSMTKMLAFWEHHRADFEPFYDRNGINDSYMRAAYDDVACYYSLLMEIRLKLWLLLLYLDSPRKPYKSFSYLPDMLRYILNRVLLSRKITKHQKNAIREVISGWLAEHLGQIHMLSSPSICKKYLGEEMDPYTMVEYQLMGPCFLMGICYYGGTDEYALSGFAPALFENDLLMRGVLDESFKLHLHRTHLLMDSGI